MKFIEVILTDGDKVLININHITMLEPNDDECVITVSSGEFLNVNESYDNVKDKILSDKLELDPERLFEKFL